MALIRSVHLNNQMPTWSWKAYNVVVKTIQELFHPPFYEILIELGYPRFSKNLKLPSVKHHVTLKVGIFQVT